MRGQLLSLLWVGVGTCLGLILFGYRPVVHALPEYATRTGEPCASCHVNPAGGGPRTVRGSLWVAAGRPDVVPPLPGASAPAAGQADDGATLYAQLGCVGCHGSTGEGAAGPALNRGELPADRISKAIRSGVGSMMAFPTSRLSDADLAVVVQYVQAMGKGALKPAATRQAIPRQPAAAVCAARQGATTTTGSCGGN